MPALRVVPFFLQTRGRRTANRLPKVVVTGIKLGVGQKKKEVMSMKWVEVILIGISLSMDALAVSLALGTMERQNFNWKKIALTAFFFGAFQAGMPLIGWLGGTLCGEWMQSYGRIVASLLLFGIGIKMLFERGDEQVPEFGLWKLTVLAFATSIDALLVGVGFACLGQSGIYGDVAVIGGITALISAVGCLVGRMFGNLVGNSCNLVGGFVLIGIGVKVIIFG